ncbi:carboxyl transferase domain-containing protein, partial [Streptomyces albidoflavus]
VGAGWFFFFLTRGAGGALWLSHPRTSAAHVSLAWPGNEIAVMGAEGAAGVVFRREIAAADDPEATRARLVKEYRAELMHPYYAAERGLVDSVIDPAETRSRLIGALTVLRAKHAPLPTRKHGNQPQ